MVWDSIYAIGMCPIIGPVFQQVFNSRDWGEREQALSKAYLILMGLHNELGVTPAITPQIALFYNRPYQVPHSARFVVALHDSIQSEVVRGFPRDVGAVGQFVNATDILSNPELCRKLMGIYD